MPGHDTNFSEDQKLDLPLISKSQVQGGTYIVTGANSGLGYEAAKHLVQFGSAKVILAVRTVSKGEEAKTTIEADTGITGIAEVWPLDLGSYDSIKAFVKRASGLERLDAVIENAGIALDKWSVSDGNETSITINVTGTLLLAALITPKLQESGKKFNILPHISIVGSGAAFQSGDRLENLSGDLLDYLNDESNFKGRYPVTKHVLLWAYKEYTTLKPVSETGVVLNYVNPGLCKSNITQHVSDVFRDQVLALNEIHGRTSEMGSRTLLHGAVAGKDSHGKYLSECAIKEDYLPDWVTNESGQNIQKQVWKSIAAHLNKVSPGSV